jgi:hypothetical protein
MNAFLEFDNTRLSFYANYQNKNVGIWYILLYYAYYYEVPICLNICMKGKPEKFATK